MSPIAATPALDRQLRPAEAARRTVGAAVARLEASAAAVLAGDDPEDVHRLRVASRRLRAALRAYREALDPRFEDRMRPELAWITRVSGVVRDLDVLALATLPALARAGAAMPGERLMRRLALRRASANRRLRDALASPRHAAMLRAFARWLEAPRDRPDARARGLPRFAAKAIGRRFRAVRRAAGRDPSSLDPASRHALRIAVKKLRYGMEVFASLWPRKAVRRVEVAVSALQGSLGRANDAATAARLLESLAAPPRFSAFARRWIAAEIEDSTASLAQQLAALDAARHAWKRAR